MGLRSQETWLPRHYSPEESIDDILGPRLAFPYDQDLPSPGPKLPGISRIPSHVATELLAPESPVGSRGRGKSAIPMPMPIAAVNEYHRLVSGEDKIRPTRKMPSVKTESKAGRMQISAHGHFGSGVGRSNPAHHPGSSRPVNDVGHRSTSIELPMKLICLGAPSGRLLCRRRDKSASSTGFVGRPAPIAGGVAHRVPAEVRKLQGHAARQPPYWIDCQLLARCLMRPHHRLVPHSRLR